MGKVLAGITISVDGFITGPGDGPGCGLGAGGERLHYWVFGGPWSYDSPGRGEPTGVDRAWLEEAMGANGAVIAGRGTPRCRQALVRWVQRIPGTRASRGAPVQIRDLHRLPRKEVTAGLDGQADLLGDRPGGRLRRRRGRQLRLGGTRRRAAPPRQRPQAPGRHLPLRAPDVRDDALLGDSPHDAPASRLPSGSSPASGRQPRRSYCR